MIPMLDRKKQRRSHVWTPPQNVYVPANDLGHFAFVMRFVSAFILQLH
jgi:hypothetical protein